LERFLRFVEAPHVLDRDHCLLREGLQQIDFLLAERPGFLAGYIDRTDDRAIAKHRDGKQASISPRPSDALGPLAPGSLLYVADERGASGPDCPSGRRVVVDGARVTLPNGRIAGLVG